MRDTVYVLLLVAIAVLVVALQLWTVPAIDQWERANNYPYGKLCDLYRNC